MTRSARDHREPARRREQSHWCLPIEKQLPGSDRSHHRTDRAAAWAGIRRIGSAAIASFPAREVVVSTMGVIFGLGADTDEDSPSLRETLESATWEGSERKLFTLPVALSIMVFFALCAQCVSTLAVIRRETNSYRWPIFTFVYMTVLAYFAAMITFQIFNAIGLK